MDKRKVIYYKSERDDEFSLTRITPKVIDGSFDYMRERSYQRFFKRFILRPVAFPLAHIYLKAVFGHRVVNGERLTPYREKAYFLYGNHTQDIADALIPSILSPQKMTYVLVHPNNVSMPYLGRLTPYLGAIPLPDDKAARQNFIGAIRQRVEEGSAIAIYPEAHIWPYYTGIRNFGDDSFSYPVKYGAPVFCFTNTYQRRQSGKKPRIVTYIDGPFFADSSLPYRQRRAELRDRVYSCMCQRARMSTEEKIKYVRVEEDD